MRRHTAWYLSLAEEAEPALKGAEQGVWLARLETEHDNLRAVLRRALEHGEQQLGLRVAGAMWRFWYVRGYVSEGRRWLEEFFSLAPVGKQGPSEGASAVRVKALTGAGGLAYIQGDAARASLHYQESLALCRALADTQGIASTLTNLGNVAQVVGDYARAKALFEESLALCRELGDTRGTAYALNNLGNVAQALGDHARGRAVLEESLVLCRELGDKQGTAYTLTNLGNVAHVLGDYARARALFEESLALCRELGEQQGIAANLEGLARLAPAPGTTPAILAHAVCLFGAAAALRAAIGMPLPLNEREGYERATTAVRAAVGEAAWATAWAEGQALTLEQAVSLALGTPSSP